MSLVRSLNFFAALALVFALGCNRPAAPDTSKIKVNLPNEKTGNSAASITCYAIMVTGSGIGNPNAQCLAEQGLAMGFVQAGGTIEILVPRGDKRNFTLYSTTGSSCRPFAEGTKELGFQFNKVGETLNVDVNQAELQVVIKAVPASATNLVSLPSSCQVASNNGVQMNDQRISLGTNASAATVGATTLVLESRVNFISTGTPAVNP